MERQNQRRKTVLVYRSRLLPTSETFIKEQVSSLQEWRAIVVGEDLLDELSLDGLDVRLLRPKRRTLWHSLSWKALKLLGRLPSKAIKSLKEERPSLIHAHFGLDAIDAWPLARTLNIPMIVTLHGYDINIEREWWEAGHGGRKMRKYPGSLLRLGQKPKVSFIAVSEAIRRRAIEYGIPAHKITVNYIGIDVTQFLPGPIPIEQRNPNVLFVGRLVEKKGCQYLIEAMAGVQQHLPQVSLTIIGDGPLRTELQALAKKLNVQARFLGAQSSENVQKQLHLASVLCLPSVVAENGDAEGFGMVLLEAQAAGVPVITSASGGAQEGLLMNLTGISFPQREVDALSTALHRVLGNPVLLKEMSKNSRDFVLTQFDIKNRVIELESRYSDVTASFASFPR